MILEKDTALEIRQIDNHLELYVHTGLRGSFRDAKDGIKVINPIEGFKLLENFIDKFQWIDRNDVLIQWENINGKRGAAWTDVAILNEVDNNPDAWLVAEVIVGRPSSFSKSRIGSTHWFNTLISEHSRIGEFMKEHGYVPYTSPDETKKDQLIVEWGKRLHDSSKELLQWAAKSENKQLTND